jgi:hypothetical protein
VTPTARLTGLALMSNGKLLATTFGGALYNYDATTGAETGPFTSALSTYTRDITVKPDGAGNDVIFGNQSGLCKKLTGGSVTNLAGYTTVADWMTGASPVPVNSTTDVRAGICYFATDDQVISVNKANPSDAVHNNAYVINASTGNVTQNLGDGTNQYGPNQLGGASDATVVMSGATRYLYIATQWPVIQVYFQPAAAVEEWSIYE